MKVFAGDVDADFLLKVLEEGLVEFPLFGRDVSLNIGLYNSEDEIKGLTR